jgi:hypothetical protein
MNSHMSFSQFQSIQGPTDPQLRHSEIEGYQPVSRIGEVVINAFGAPPARGPPSAAAPPPPRPARKRPDSPRAQSMPTSTARSAPRA